VVVIKLGDKYLSNCRNMLFFSSVAIRVIQKQHPIFTHYLLIISLQNREIINGLGSSVFVRVA